MENKKCSNCGGTIIIQPGATYGICEYCGSKVDLNVSWQEREDLLKNEAIQKNEIKKVEDKINIVKNQITEIENGKNLKVFNIIQIALSVVAIIFGFSGTSLPENIGDTMMGISMIALIIAIVFLIKYTSYFEGKKGRAAIISVLELFTLGIYGAVAGVIYLVKLIKSQNELNQQKLELENELRKLESEVQEIKNNSEFKL